MKKIRFGILRVLMGLVISFLAAGCSGNSEPAAVKGGVAENELDSAVWGEIYPIVYQSCLKNNQQSKTEFGGSEK